MQLSTVQIVGIAVAAVIVLLLVIALLVTRRRGATDSEEQPLTDTHASFLDEAPQDTLAALGKAEQPMEDITIDPRAPRQAAPPPDAAAVIAATAAAREREHGALGLDWGPSGDTHRGDELAEMAGGGGAAPADDITTGELPAAASAVDWNEPVRDVATQNDAPTDAPQPASPAGDQVVAGDAARGPGPAGQGVPLSDIIVTTSHKMVDLHDPEVRRMLADLVRFEIDQATQYRLLGQNIDAVLQLTEAEKISRALEMPESATEIRKMIKEPRGPGLTGAHGRRAPCRRRSS